MTHQSGVEPAPVEVPQLIPCGCFQPNHVKVQYVVHYVQLIELVCQYIRNNKHLLPMRDTLDATYRYKEKIQVYYWHMRDIQVLLFIRCWTCPCRSTTIDPMCLFFSQNHAKVQYVAATLHMYKCSVFCVCHGLCSNNNIEDDYNNYEMNHNLNV